MPVYVKEIFAGRTLTAGSDSTSGTKVFYVDGLTAADPDSEALDAAGIPSIGDRWSGSAKELLCVSREPSAIGPNTRTVTCEYEGPADEDATGLEGEALAGTATRWSLATVGESGETGVHLGPADPVAGQAIWVARNVPSNRAIYDATVQFQSVSKLFPRVAASRTYWVREQAVADFSAKVGRINSGAVNIAVMGGQQAAGTLLCTDCRAAPHGDQTKDPYQVDVTVVAASADDGDGWMATVFLVDQTTGRPFPGMKAVRGKDGFANPTARGYTDIITEGAGIRSYEMYESSSFDVLTRSYPLPKGSA